MVPDAVLSTFCPETSRHDHSYRRRDPRKTLAEGAQVLNLLALCRTPEYLHVWQEGPELLRRFARLLLKQGHPTLALEVAARGLDARLYPDDHDLLFCRARALVNCGNPTRAEAFVREFLERTDLPIAIRSDALSLAGRIRKDLAARGTDRDVRRPPAPRSIRALRAGVRAERRYVPRHQRGVPGAARGRDGPIRASLPGCATKSRRARPARPGARLLAAGHPR